MSQENVETVRRLIEAAASDNPSVVKDLIAFVDPDVEFRSVLNGVEGSSYRGHDGRRRYVSDLQQSWREWRNEIVEIEEIGPKTILGTLLFKATGKDSGVSVERRSTMLFRFSEQGVVSAHTFDTRDEALESVSL